MSEMASDFIENPVPPANGNGAPKRAAKPKRKSKAKPKREASKRAARKKTNG